MPFSREEKAKAKAAQWGKTSSASSQQEDSAELCCKPGGCMTADVSLDDPSDRVRVLCSSDACPLSGLMHVVCFNDFEEQVLTFLKGTGRARSWSDKQRRQNLWNKKGYDLAFKACNCECGKGFLKKDVDYKPPVSTTTTAATATSPATASANDAEDKRKKKSRKPSEKPAINVGKPGPIGSASHARSYSSSSGYSTCSSSSGSLNELSASSSSSSLSSGNGGGGTTAKKCNGNDSSLSAFPRRADLAVFKNVLPRTKINPYAIRMDDDVLGGLDDLRQLVLGGLASQRVTKLPCCLCRRQLVIFEKYPVVDGVLFLTPLEQKLPSGRPVGIRFDSKILHVMASCVQCIAGPTRVLCRSCSHPWSGENLVLGAIYSYDIFAAVPCCESRVLCAECQRPAIEQTGASMLSYSQCSGVFGCEHCSFESSHLIQPLSSYEIISGSQ